MSPILKISLVQPNAILRPI